MRRSLFVCLLWAGISCSSVSHAATFNVTNSSGFAEDLATASSNGEDNTINLAAGTYSSESGFVYTGTGHTLTLIGANTSTIDDASIITSTSGDGITFTFTGTVQVSGITVRESDTGLVFKDASPAPFDATMNVSIQNSHFTGNSDGGVSVYNQSIVGTVEVRDNLFDHNTKSSEGGGLYVLTQNINSPITLTGNVFDHNTPPDPDHPHALLVGGGATLKSSTGDSSSPITVGGFAEGEGNTFTGNTALSSGGIFVYTYSSASLVGNTLIGNSADPDDGAAVGGGATVQYAGAGEFSNNIVQDNSAFSAGGLNMGPLPSGDIGTFVFNANLFSGNSSQDCGGANISNYVRSAPLIVTNNIFLANYVTSGSGSAGALCLTEPNNPSAAVQDIDVINNTFAHNFASPGATFVGGLSIAVQQAGITVNLYNNIFFQNTSPYDMKDVYVYPSGTGWGELNFYNNDVVNDSSVPDPAVATNICIENPDPPYGHVCNTGNDFSALPNTNVGPLNGSEYILYDVDPVFFGAGNLAEQYSLSANSLLIQAGNPNAPQLPQFDYTGTVPMDTPNPDLGALQYCVPNLSMTITPNSDTITLRDNITWTVALNNTANCSSNDNTLTLTFTNSEFESADQASASLSKQLASVLHSSSASVSCSGAGTNATCTIARIPNAASVNLSVLGSTQSLGEIGLSATLSNALGTASGSGSGSATVVPAPAPNPNNLSGAGCELNAVGTNSANVFWIYSLMMLLPMMKFRLKNN